jgi:tol-pal system protein YbgF
MRKSVTAAFLAALLGVAGSASAQNREHQQMTAELRMLQEQTQLLASALATLNQALVDSLKALNTRLDQSADATRQAFADQKLLIDSIEDGVRVIRERSNDTNVRIGELREELEALRDTVHALQQTAVAPPAVVDPNAPAGTAASGSPEAAVQPPIAPAPAPTPSAAGLSPTRLYETARADYFSGQWTSAVNGFEAFLRAFPRSEQADDAQFHIGETYYAQNQWTQAIAAYNQVIQGYPGTNAVPDAYYKRGLAQERQGQADAARASWEAVAKNFPDSDAGRLAKQNIDRLGRTP